MSDPARSASPTALVLGSGGARAAYEAGVAHFLFDDLHRQLGHAPAVRILCGSSAGALNAFGLACFADRPISGVAFLAQRWAALELGDFVRPQIGELLRLGRTVLGCPPAAGAGPRLQGGILDPRAFRAKVVAGLPRAALRRHLAEGRLAAVTCSATEIATGRAVVFLESDGRAPAGHLSEGTSVVATTLTTRHAFASAAIPLLFPPVRIQGRRYCDGSLRQSVPLAPALHLGAERVIAVSTQHLPARVSPLVEHEREQAAGNPLYLLGKTINALTLDRIDDDFERLRLVNALLAAGDQAFGADFLARLNHALAADTGRTVRPIEAVLVRPSQSLGALAADYVRSHSFARRNPGALGRLFVRLAEGESEHDADLLSYLLFDGPFAQQLMELGRADARAQASELGALLARGTDLAADTAVPAANFPPTQRSDP